MTHDPTKSLGERLHLAYRAAIGHLDGDRSLFGRLPAADQSHWERAAVNFVARLSDAPAPIEDHPDTITPAEWDGDARAAGFRAGLIQGAWILRNAANTHEAEAVLSKTVVGSEGNTFAARILRSYSNGLEMEADKPLPPPGFEDWK